MFMADTPALSAARVHCFGSHLSIAGGVHNAIVEARRLGFETVQVFVKNQRQWTAPPLSDADVSLWNVERDRMPIGPIIAHATYLVNLASADPVLLQKSRDAFADELRRCDALGITGLVVHPGAAVGQSPDDAIRRVSESLNWIFERDPAIRAMPLLETTAGQGSTLGRTFGELGAMIAGVAESQRVGICIDTCHVFAAGYDIRDPATYAEMIALAERTVGLHRVRCWHLNDSRGDLGSRLDRHEHIGRGMIGDAGFANVVRDPRFTGVPMILETPKEPDESGVDWDTVNVSRLRDLAAGRTPPAIVSVPSKPTKSKAANSTREKAESAKTASKRRTKLAPKAGKLKSAAESSRPSRSKASAKPASRAGSAPKRATAKSRAVSR